MSEDYSPSEDIKWFKKQEAKKKKLAARKAGLEPRRYSAKEEHWARRFNDGVRMIGDSQ